MSTKRPTEKNTKTEILAAFDELLREKKTLETQLTAKPIDSGRNGNAASVITPSTPPAKLNPQKIESIVENLAQLQLSIGGAVSDLSEKLTLDAFKLQDVQQAVAVEVEQLQTLHNLQVTDDSLDTLIQQYDDSFKTFDEEFNQRQETLEQEFAQAKKSWVKEQEERRRAVKERNETTNKTRDRDAKEYSYDRLLQRTLSDSEFEQEQKQLYQALEELQQTQEKQWSEREKAIAERETQFADLKTEVEAFPRDLEIAVKRAKEEGKGIANQQAKVKADLIAKEIEGSKRTYELQIQALLDTIQSQESRIQTLAKQLDAALKQVQDLAVKAIEGASNVSSFQAVKEIAIEQAKNQNKAK